ncbi:sec-independent protein translocase protein TatA [Thermanaeromonas toyohensis ToBE]|uniref:Sec-independent protein translocase protein TatA n=1 Tax=Thermanaeromonas toyohensis ToBE TaxID=698762 RepID=A0A1W1VZ85_9FIRM|nr:Sec-independent protein translocase protein TatB [Thermanaeromonas toyohensis]SMB98164.1 sec-independent protein translocase protein TatA [Thermanaeromonas toyohensis ToBE]
MFNLGVPELLLILVLALILFGPGKLPEVGRALGKGIREFKKATSSLTEELEEAAKLEEIKTQSKMEGKAEVREKEGKV